jgi:hypothetical protein
MAFISGPVIAAGQSLSSVLDLSKASDLGLRRITMPAQWTGTAWLTFQFSLDNANFHEVVWPDGSPLIVTVVPNATAFLRHDVWRLGYFKFRSGSAANPVIQTAARTFQCATY